MKRLIKEACNSCNIPAKTATDYIQSADDEEIADEEVVEITIEDKIKQADNDVDYILDGIMQLGEGIGNQIIEEFNTTLQEYIQRIADQIAGE